MSTTRLDSSIKPEIERSLNPRKSEFSREGMIMAVARKKHQRLKKGSDFACMVVEGSIELSECLKKLLDYRNTLKTNTRFQILYLYDNVHWFPLDCQLNEEKQFTFFLIDPAIFSDSLLETRSCILEQMPDATINFLALTPTTKIQRCYKNCGTFALDIAFGLSRIPNTFELLSKVVKPQSDSTQIKSLVIEDLPVELGFIIRNMHSISTLKKLSSKKNYLSNSQTLVRDYFNKHTESKPNGGEANVGIDYKLSTIKSRSFRYFKTLFDYEIAALLTYNDNFIDELINDKKTSWPPNELERKTHFPSGQSDSKYESIIEVHDLPVEEDPYEMFYLTSSYPGQAILGWVSTCSSLLFTAVKKVSSSRQQEHRSSYPPSRLG